MRGQERRLTRLEDAAGRCPACGNPGPPPSLVAGPEWRAVLGALRKHPDALLAVSQALREVGP